MRKTILGRICILVFVLLCGLAVRPHVVFAQSVRPDVLARNPMLSSDQIRILRQNSTETVLRAKFMGARGDSIEIIAGKDFGAWREHDYTKIYDYRLYRTFRLNQEESTFVSRSLFAEVKYSHDVMWARMRRLKLLLSEGKKPWEELPPHRGDFYWLSIDLGEMPVLGDYTGATQTALSHGGFSLTYQGRVVMEFEPAETLFPAPLVDVFYRIIQEDIKVHPKAVATMKATGRIPKRLKTVYWETRLDQFVEGELNFQHLARHLWIIHYPVVGRQFRMRL